ncbi:MAG: efflux RND transporter periplasmic adaptor subunit [Candidatus Brocadiae bacterium]|nr:efflux RND transporter periplasmic adaptor subunit [Candidatus Brocadiia bacterium]
MKTPIILTVALAGIAGAFLAGRLSVSDPAAPAESTTAAATDQVWTCSMHPQIRLPNPGNCPICSMPLIPVEDQTGAAGGAPSLQLSDAALAMAAIETAPVTRRPLFHEIRTNGRVEPNETALTTVTSRVEGWVEKLFVDATGVRVEKDDHLLELYSPELISDQRELLIALRTNATPELLKAARARLERWGMAGDEIDRVLKTKEVLEFITIHAPTAGTVLEKSVVKGTHVGRGDTLYRLADLGSVWVHLDIYEYEIGWVQPGQEVSVVAESQPGSRFDGVVTFVSPILNDATRTIRVRVALPNPGGRLKPGMFVSASLRVALLRSGLPAPTARAGKWTCPMHPEVVAEEPGPCPQCGMALEQFPGSGRVPSADDLRVPAILATAVLDSGTRHLAYVLRGPGRFEQREIVVGPRCGDWFPVISGLEEGEQVAVRGGFLIDSQFQIRGLPSLFRPGGAAAAPPHAHGGGTGSPPGNGGSGHEGSDHGK